MTDTGQNRLVDLAISYAGMGHVLVLSYDPVSQHVFTTFDGGPNGFDRQYNHEARVRLAVEDIAKVPLTTWWDEQPLHDTPS